MGVMTRYYEVYRSLRSGNIDFLHNLAWDEVMLAVECIKDDDEVVEIKIRFQGGRYQIVNRKRFDDQGQ